MLDSLSRAFLVALDHLTRDTYGDTDGTAVKEGLAELGFEPDDEVLLNLAKRLRDDDYIEVYLTAGGFENASLIRLTSGGRNEAQEADPVERVEMAARRLLTLPGFPQRFPGAYEKWRDAESLLWADANERELTTIGHKAREAMQSFATAPVEEHQPPGVDADPARARSRMGAVIAMHRPQLGETRRKALEALGDLWEATDLLVQRQEHGATKEGTSLRFSDARRSVVLTLLLMVELVETLDDLT